MLKILSGLIAVFCLAYASYEDIRTHMVPDFIWWIMAAGSLLLLTGAPICFSSGNIAGHILSIFIQEKLMSRYYGRADSHAFSCCALFLMFSGYGLEAHILHLTLSLALLTFIQLIRRNITRSLKLRTPVPFIPYISVAFLISYLLVNSAHLC